MDRGACSPRGCRVGHNWSDLTRTDARTLPWCYFHSLGKYCEAGTYPGTGAGALQISQKVVLTLTFRKQLSCPASGTFWVPHRCIGISRNLLLSIIRAIKYFLSALILKTDTEVHWEIYNVVFFPAFTSSPKLGSKYKISFHTWPDIKWHKQLKRLWGIMWVPWRWLSEFTANCVKFSIALQEEHFQNNEHLHWGLAGRVYYCWWWLFCSVLCF